MYRYDNLDQALVDQRVAQFRDQVARRLRGDLSEEAFKPLRLMNGLYLQLHAYMLRVAIPYGTLSPPQMRQLARIARVYDRGYGHFTTRQNIQFNWLKLADTPDVLAELAKVEMHAIQTSGNCIRNITTDPFAGAAADEIDDPRIYAELIRQWSTLHPEFSFLPRKFKIAITGAANDRAAVRVHDIGLFLVRGPAGDTGFRVMVGGGLGRTPMIGKTIRDFLPHRHLLSYLEAILRVYNRYGRRDNMYKARIKILVHERGIDEFRDAVEAAWAQRPHARIDAPAAETGRIRGFFAPPPAPGPDPAPPRPDLAAPDLAAPDLAARRRDNPDFDRWAGSALHPHRQPGRAIVTVSLKPMGKPPGDATADQMDVVADLAERYGHGDIRVTHEQNLVLPHVAERDLFAVWQALARHDLATPNVGLISDIIACPGLDYCALANARSIPVAQAIARRFADLDRQYDLGTLRLKISGCINACGHHHVGHIGILGVDRKGEEYYQITLGGAADDQASVGQIVGPAIPRDDVPAAIENLVATYVGQRRAGERFIDTWRRVGRAPFRENLYANR